MSDEPKFQVGDMVEAFGLPGVVIERDDQGDESFPIAVSFQSSMAPISTFTSDGRYHEWCKEPSLKLISRPSKPKEKLKKKVWVQGFSNLPLTMDVSCFYQIEIEVDSE